MLSQSTPADKAAADLPRSITGKLSDHLSAFYAANEAFNAAVDAMSLAEATEDEHPELYAAAGEAHDKASDTLDLAIARVTCTRAHDLVELGQQAKAFSVLYCPLGIYCPTVEPESFSERDAIMALLTSLLTLASHEERRREAMASVSREAWEAAMAAYGSAVVKNATTERTYEVAVSRLFEEAPIPASLRDANDDGALMWHTEDEILDANRGDLERAMRLIGDLRAYRAKKADVSGRLGLEEIGNRDDQAGDELARAETVIIHTPAPDLSALSLKMGLSIEREDWRATDNSPEHFRALLTGENRTVQALARMYQDVLRLNGTPGKLADLEPFSQKARASNVTPALAAE